MHGENTKLSSRLFMLVRDTLMGERRKLYSKQLGNMQF